MGRPRLGTRRGAAVARRAGARFIFVATSLACLAAGLTVLVAIDLLRSTGTQEPPATIAIQEPTTSPPATRPESAAVEAVPVGDAPTEPTRTVRPPAVGAASGNAAIGQRATAGRPPAAAPTRPATQPPIRPKARPTRPRKTLILVVDDAGYNMKELEAFLRLPFPITVAVLPQLPYSAQAARAVRAAGKELILHQPMEALGGQNPGPGAILADMSPAEAQRIVEENLRTVPGAMGMNNHMGSAVTTRPAIMDAVAAIAKKCGIYYLDSLTISGTASHEAALREGIRYWERDVFLDNAPDRASIIRAVEDGKKRADTGRPAVMIGHVWSAELAQTMMDLYPQLVAEGYSLSTISRYMLSEAEDDADTGD